MKNNRTIAVLLTLVLGVFLFSGCVMKEKSPTINDTLKVSPETNTNIVGKMNISGLPICTEPQTFKITVPKSALSKNTFPEKPCVKDTEQKTNVKIEWMEIPSSGYDEKVNIMFASGDLPDAMLGNIDVVKNLASLASLNDAIEKYAPSIQHLFVERPEVKKAVTAQDGNIYCLPTGDESYNNKVGNNLWINKLWLDNLGMSIPTTTSEFYNALKAFKDKDPNRNGKPDEIPFTASQSGNNSNIDNMFGSFGTLDSPEHVRVENGKVIFSPSENSYYEGLQWLNKLFAEDLMDKETFIQNKQQYFSKGKSADIIGSLLSFSPDEVIGVEWMDNFVSVIPLKGPEGRQLWSVKNDFKANGFSVTKICKTPEVLIRWYDYLNSDVEIALEWNRGPKDIAWRFNQDGKWEIASDNQPKDISYGEWRQTISPAATAPVFMKNAWVGPDGQNFTTSRDKLKVDTVKSYLPFGEKESLPNGLDDPDRADQRNLLAIDIDNYIKKFKASSIMQKVDETDWENHLNTLKILKVDEYTKLWQDFLDSQE